MHTVRLTALLVAGALSARAMSAQQAPRPACLDTAETQGSMTRCAGSAFLTLDTLLMHLVTDLHGKLLPAEARQLDSTQANWTAYSSSQCRLANADSRTGSAYPMLVAMCRGTHTATRIEELAPLLCGHTQLVATQCPAADEYLARVRAVR